MEKREVGMLKDRGRQRWRRQPVKRVAPEEEVVSGEEPGQWKKGQMGEKSSIQREGRDCKLAELEDS